MNDNRLIKTIFHNMLGLKTTTKWIVEGTKGVKEIEINREGAQQQQNVGAKHTVKKMQRKLIQGSPN